MEKLKLEGILNEHLDINEGEHATLSLFNASGYLEINLKENASLLLDELSINDAKLNVTINLAANTNLKLTNVFFGTSLNHYQIHLSGYKANVIQNTLAFVKDKSEVIKTSVYHEAKETNSNIKNYGIALDNGNVSFETTGKIFKGNSKSKCVQLSRGMIIGNNAYIKSFPILLIDEYDVSANHGAAIGKLSDDELFYLMSRGLTKEEAYKLMVEAIIHPVIDSYFNEDFKKLALELLNKNI